MRLIGEVDELNKIERMYLGCLINEEPNVDLISRAEVLALINKAMFNTDNKDIQDYIFNGLRRDVHNLPSEVCGDCIWRVCNYNSVDWEKPSTDRPKGEWIFNPTDAIDLMFAKPKCSKCGFESSDGGNYCSNCGADMRGEK